MKLAILLFSVCAKAQVEAPSIGRILDASGMMRAVYGVAGNFVLGPAELDSLPSSVRPELRLSGAEISSNETELVVRRPDASEVRFPLDGVSGLRVMSADWVQVIVGSRSYALRIEAGREALFVLPELSRPEVRRR